MELIAIGKIAKPIGTGGHVKVIPLTDSPERFESLKSISIGPQADAATAREITSKKIFTAYIELGLFDVTTRTAAEKFRGQYLFVAQDESIRPRQGSYFIDEIIGCTVVDESEKTHGTVSDVLNVASHDIWVVRTANGQYLIPAVKEFIRKVDLKGKCITVHAVEGLFE